MSKENERMWEELSNAMNRLPRNLDYDNEAKAKSEPDILKAAKETKKLFDAYTEAGFTSVQALRLIAEIVVRGNDE